MKKTDLPSSLVIFDGPTNIKAILRSSIIPWKRLDMLGDPFQPGLAVELPFTRGELLEACIKEAIAMIFGLTHPQGLRQHNIQKAIKRWRQEDRFDNEDEARSALHELLLPLIEQHFEQLAILMESWQEYADKTRLLRLFQNHTALSLWENFTNHHRGAALRFRCDDDTTIASAQPVRYASQPKMLIEMKQEVDLLLGNDEITRDNLQDFLMTRNRELKNEKEWRSFKQADTSEITQQLIKTPFEASELSTIYLGACMTESDHQLILELVKTHYPHTKVYKAKPKSRHFELSFIELDNE
ncbi:MAG: hypothetical protein AAGB12_09870 [Pseudomonadota bacterium]